MSRKPSAFSIPICVFSLTVIRCMVVTMVRIAIARNRTGRMDPMVFPSSTSPCASAQEIVSSFDSTSSVRPSARSIFSTKSAFSREDFTFNCIYRESPMISLYIAGIDASSIFGEINAYPWEE